MTPALSFLVLTILAMCSKKHSQAFPLDRVNRGAEFVATLRLFYPHADTLCEKDFDWLFDCPHTKQFLEWFCSTVTKENVLNPAEVEAYEALLAAGKPILEGEALEKALQTCHQVPQLPTMIPDDEDPSLEALQQELQVLNDYRDHLLRQYSKLQVCVTSLQQELRYLEEEEEAAQQDLRKAKMDLEGEIFHTSAVLSQISEAAKQLAEWHRNMGKSRPPALLCEMDLDPYMELEQLATDRLEQYIQQVLPGTVMASDAEEASAKGEKRLQESLESGMHTDREILEGRGGAPHQEYAKILWGTTPSSQGIQVQGSRVEMQMERRNGEEVLSMGDEEEADGSQEATDRTDAKQTTRLKSLGTEGDELLEDQDSYWKELCQIEKAHICAQREVIVMSAKVEGHCAALEWAQKMLEALEENQHVVKVELWHQTPTLQKQLRTLHCDITQTLTHQLPPLLRIEAHRSILPILQRQLSLEAARLQDDAGKQKEVAAWLANQYSRLELLELLLKWERKELDQKATQLREMEAAMKEFHTRLQELQDYFKDASSSQEGCPRTWIDPKDRSAVRLWDMLMGQDQQEQPSHSYEALAARCSQLVQEQKALEAQLAPPMPQLPALESSTLVLYRLLYDSSNQLQLSSPELTELMQQLTTLQDKLHQMLTDLLSDLKVKRRSLESPILQRERDLYVYFYCNEDRLQEVVEELEKQALASSQGPRMELPYAKE